ncbi:MAG TPA: hypothetical protein VJT76_02245 [Gaiella sp.]|nr:hypothetical protein [Gaiella sp.]
MEKSEIEKIARTESLFREVNERIAESAQYERVREDGNAFLLTPGHEDERVEAVVRSCGELAVVEKQHPLVRRLVLELDPRAA